MDGLLGEERVFDGAEEDFKYILDSDVFHNVPMTDHLDGLSSSSYYEYDYLFDDDPLLSADKDKMVSPDDDPCDTTPPHINSEHSYSMMSEPNSPLMKEIKQEADDLDSNYDTEGLDDMLPVSPENDDNIPFFTTTTSTTTSSPDTPSPTLHPTLTTGYLLMDKLTGAKSILTTANRASLARMNAELKPTTTTLQQKQEGSKIKLELVTMMNVDNGLDSTHHMPPTPPGSTASDSDGSESPQRSVPSSPRAIPIQPAKRPICHTRTVSPHLFTNIQKLPQSGPLHLTEEEKRTLRQEGYPIPTKLPLTKAEEKSLKKVRRKIKNKISAQESRRKKKEYLEALEKRMDSYTSENSELKRKVENLENTNQSLVSQLSKLQSIVNKISKPIKAHSTQTGTCLMVLVLCFAVFLGSWTPHAFLNSNQHLPKLFSSSSSNDDMPHPFFGPYGNNIQYSAPSFHGDDVDDQQDKIFRMYGPKPASPSEQDDDPYGTYSMRSSRTLLSYQEEEDTLAFMDPRYHDDSHALPNDITPEVPSFGKIAAAIMGSDTASVESEEIGYEGYVMHPDMEARIIPVDTMALINRSSNK